MVVATIYDDLMLLALGAVFFGWPFVAVWFLYRDWKR